MAGKNKDTDIQQDSDVELDTETNETDDLETEIAAPVDSREAIADRINEQRLEEISETEDEIEDDKLDEEQDPEKDRTPNSVTLKIDGEEVEVSQADLERNYQFDQSARKKMTENSALQKKLLQGLDDLEKQKATQTVQTPPDLGQEQKLELDFEDISKKIREGSDEEALEALQQLAANLTPATQELPDVTKLVDDRLAEIDQKAEDARVQASADVFADAETQFKVDFKADIEASGDFFELAAMEDRKLVNDPEWQDKPIGERLTEAGSRAKNWLSDTKAGDNRRTRLSKKERHAPRRSAARRTNIGKDQKPPTTSSIIADMAKGRGQMV